MNHSVDQLLTELYGAPMPVPDELRLRCRTAFSGSSRPVAGLDAPRPTDDLQVYAVPAELSGAEAVALPHRRRALVGVAAAVLAAAAVVAGVLVINRPADPPVAASVETIEVPSPGGEVCNAQQLCVSAQPTATGYSIDVTFANATLHHELTSCDIGSLNASGRPGVSGGPSGYVGLAPATTPLTSLPGLELTQFNVALPSGDTFQVFGSQSTEDVAAELQNALTSSTTPTSQAGSTC